MRIANSLLTAIVASVLCCLPLAVSVRAQQVEDPEDEKEIGLWLDQGISYPFTTSTSLEVEFHQRFDERVSRFFEYFVQSGIAFRPSSWLTITPSYRYQRFPGNSAVQYENRLLLDLTVAKSRGPWRPNLRTRIEGRFPDNRPAFARLRFRPGIEYTLPLRTARPPVVIVSNDFFFVPGENGFIAGGTFTQNRFQVAVRIPVTPIFSIRPYYMLQSVDLPASWDTNQIIGFSMAFRIPQRTRSSP